MPISKFNGFAPPAARAKQSAAGIPHDVLQAAKHVALATGGDGGAVQRFMASQGIHKYGNWCGEFAASVVKSAGYRPPDGYPVASNWRRWGAPDPTPHAGDIAVRRGVPTGSTGSHVGIVGDVGDQSFTLIGGNQGRIEKSQMIGRYEFRRPTEEWAARQAIDGATRAASRVEGTGKITVDVNAPKGTSVSAQGGGIFKKTEVNRQTQMEGAKTSSDWAGL